MGVGVFQDQCVRRIEVIVKMWKKKKVGGGGSSWGVRGSGWGDYYWGRGVYGCMCTKN